MEKETRLKPHRKKSDFAGSYQGRYIRRAKIWRRMQTMHLRNLQGFESIGAENETKEA